MAYRSSDRLRRHARDTFLPGDFPEQAFSTVYAQKDLSYALELARDTGHTLTGAENVKALFEKTVEAGFGDNYWPAVINVIDRAKD